MPASFNVELDSGASYLLKFRLFTQSADVRTAVSMTGLVILYRVQDAERFTKTTKTLTVDDAGYVNLDLSPEQTSLYLPHRRYRYNIDLLYPTGRIRRILQGSLHSSAMAVSND